MKLHKLFIMILSLTMLFVGCSGCMKRNEIATDYNVLPAITDPVFKACIQSEMEEWDTDKDGQLSKAEANKVTSILCSYNGSQQKIKSLAGIEHFTRLEFLDCSFNELKELDLSKNIFLQELYCSSNELKTLNLTNNYDLEVLKCPKNQLTSLDILRNKKLKNLICGFNHLTELNVSNMTFSDDGKCGISCGQQVNNRSNSLILYLREGQKPYWESTLKSRSDNEGVVIAG